MTQRTDISTKRAAIAAIVAIHACFACSSESTPTDHTTGTAVAGGSGINGGAGATLPGTSGMGGTSGSGLGGSSAAGTGMPAAAGAAAGNAGAAGASAAGMGGASGMSGMAAGAGAGAGGAGSTNAGMGGAAGTVAGGSGGNGGGEETCPLPATFKWTSGGPLAQPKNGWVSLKDFTHVRHENKHIVYMTTHDQTTNWGSAMFVFDDWPDAASVPQTRTTFGVAPTLFYFSPKNIWVIAYQWGRYKFSYRTSSNPLDPNGWSAEQSLYNTALPPSGTGPIDQTVICDSTDCYLYYAGDNGHIYKSSLPIDSFPGQFPGAVDSGIAGTTQNLFEGVQVYTVKGGGKYLMLVEAQGSGRYFRAWTATELGGPWTLLTDAFASKSNVTFTSGAWTNDISHGDLIRNNPDETFTVDPCNLQMIFQGRDPNVDVSYGLLPYRPGLLTLTAQ